VRRQRGAEMTGARGVERVVLLIKAAHNFLAGNARIARQTEARFTLSNRSPRFSEKVVVLPRRVARDSVVRDVEPLKDQRRLQQVHMLTGFTRLHRRIVVLRTLDPLVISPGFPRKCHCRPSSLSNESLEAEVPCDCARRHALRGPA
jgi:hypothetical protein